MHASAPRRYYTYTGSSPDEEGLRSYICQLVEILESHFEAGSHRQFELELPPEFMGRHANEVVKACKDVGIKTTWEKFYPPFGGPPTFFRSERGTITLTFEYFGAARRSGQTAEDRAEVRVLLRNTWNFLEKNSTAPDMPGWDMGPVILPAHLKDAQLQYILDVLDRLGVEYRHRRFGQTSRFYREPNRTLKLWFYPKIKRYVWVSSAKADKDCGSGLRRRGVIDGFESLELRIQRKQL